VSVDLLLREFERVTDAPDAISRLRPFIVRLALRGDVSHTCGLTFDAGIVSRERMMHGMEVLLRTRPKYRRNRGAAPAEGAAPVPNGWCAATLDDTGLYVNGVAFKPGVWRSTGRPIIRIQNLSGQSCDYHFTDDKFSMDNIANSGDLLVSWSATLDAFIWNGPQGVVNQHIFKVIPNPEAVTPDFLYWLLKHEIRELAKSQHAHGLAMMHINRGPFLAHEVFLPSLAEQDWIVAKLDQMMTLCDELEAAQVNQEAQRDALRHTTLQRMKSSYRAEISMQENMRFFLQQSPRLITKPEHVTMIRHSILDLAVRGHLCDQRYDEGNGRDLLARINRSRREAGTKTPVSFAEPEEPLPLLPATWTWAAIDQVASEEARAICDGPFGANLKTAHYIAAPGYRVIRLENIGHGSFRGALRTYITQEHWEQLSKHHVFAGDLVVAGLVDPLVRACEVPKDIGPTLVKADCYRFHVHPQFASRFALYYLNSPVFQSFASAHHHGMTLTRLGLGNFRRLPIPVPPPAEQDRIIAKVDQLMAVCDELEAALASAQTGRGRLLEALLHEALNESAGWRATAEALPSAV
jgi:type I restriction enzyme S subunit